MSDLGPFSEVGLRNRHVCFPPDSDRMAVIVGCLKSANSRRRAPMRLVCDRESARQHEVGRQLRWDHLRHPIAKARQVDACEQGFTAAQNDGRHRQVHLVDCSCE
jgi:hypothetical protein